jgi:hypothetical protein
MHCDVSQHRAFRGRQNGAHWLGLGRTAYIGGEADSKPRFGRGRLATAGFRPASVAAAARDPAAESLLVLYIGARPGIISLKSRALLAVDPAVVGG